MGFVIRAGWLFPPEPETRQPIIPGLKKQGLILPWLGIGDSQFMVSLKGRKAI